MTDRINPPGCPHFFFSRPTFSSVWACPEEKRSTFPPPSHIPQRFRSLPALPLSVDDPGNEPRQLCIALS